MQWFWLLFSKSGETPPALLARAILVTVVQMKAQPLARVWTLPGQDVSLRQLRLVATGEFLGTASGAGFLGLNG